MENKFYYSISDAAEIISENPSTLRYWETEFDFLKPRRALKGRRLYTAEDLEKLKIIKFLLRTRGMHITAAKEQLKNNSRNISKKLEAITLLEDVKKDLELLSKSLKKIQSTK